MRRIVIALLLACPLAVTGAAFEKGWSAASSGDFATALREWLPLGERGHAAAQYNLGVMCESGQGVPQDHPQALYWYRKAADQEHIRAQSNLSVMYDDGRGIQKDYAQAVHWYRKAARQGDAIAQSNLGVIYGNGQGVEQDYVRAYAWIELAAAQGNANAARNRDTIRHNMNTVQVAKARQLSRQLLLPPKPPPQPVTAQALLSAPRFGGRKVERPADRIPLMLSNETVRLLQEYLTALGYDPGPVDGVIGRRTVIALKQAQVDLKVAPTGEVTPELLELLRTVAAAAGASS